MYLFHTLLADLDGPMMRSPGFLQATWSRMPLFFLCLLGFRVSLGARTTTWLASHSSPSRLSSVASHPHWSSCWWLAFFKGLEEVGLPRLNRRFLWIPFLHRSEHLRSRFTRSQSSQHRRSVPYSAGGLLTTPTGAGYSSLTSRSAYFRSIY